MHNEQAPMTWANCKVVSEPCLQEVNHDDTTNTTGFTSCSLCRRGSFFDFWSEKTTLQFSCPNDP